MKTNVKDNKTGIVGLIIIFGLLVLGSLAYFIIDTLYSKCDEKKICSENYVFKEQCFNREDCPKFSECPKLRLCPKPKECPTVEEIKVDEAYRQFAQNYIKFRNGFELNTQPIEEISNDYQPWISYAEVDAKGDLYVSINSSSLKEEYGNKYKVLSGVLKIDIFEFGNGGFKKLIAIMEDGSISVLSQVDSINNNTLTAINYKEYKNIVDLKTILVTDGFGGGRSVVAIDIAGNPHVLKID